MSRSISDSMYSAASRWRSTGSRHDAVRAHEVEQVVRGRADAPQRAFAGERHPLVAERHLGEPPAVVLRRR